MGVDAQDIDNDGLPDIVFAALDGETFPLFRNLGKRGFADATRSSGLTHLTLPMAGTPLRLPTSTTTDGRISLSPAGTCKRSNPDRTCRSISRTRFSGTWAARSLRDRKSVV